MDPNPYESSQLSTETDPSVGAGLPERREFGAIAYGVVVRTLGLIIFLYGLAYLIGSISILLGAHEEYPGDRQAYFVYGLIYILGGNGVVFGAPMLVRLSYPGMSPHDYHY